MKRLLIVVLAILLLFAAGCQNKTADKAADDTVPPSEAATEAPYIDTQISEPEWIYYEGSLQLEGDGTVYAATENILYFAIVTNNDGTQELRFRLDDATAEKLKGQSDITCFVTHDGTKIGDATLSEDGTVATVSQENAQGDITALATKIRGLYE